MGLTLMNEYQEFIALSRYARWLPEENRRESWTETVQRYVDHVLVPSGLGSQDIAKLQGMITNIEALPSMRALMTAGPALDRCNVAGYNCSYLPVDSPRAFDETMYILMCGTGVGFSVEDQYVQRLPIVNEHFEQSSSTISVGDSKAGWARGLRELVGLLYAGQVPRWDFSAVRPAGARLKTFGGRASGPEPLDGLFRFFVDVFQRAAGRRLTPLECHDLMCKIGEVVVVGGVRRSAMISLSNLNDPDMAKAKSGNWWQDNVQRALANNSACYLGDPSVGTFLREWTNLYESGSGERGIFNREASQRQAARSGRRQSDIDFGTNPCSEIILRPHQFCNLTEVVVRATDKFEDLRDKVWAATVLGTIQSKLTNFKYLRKIWAQNTEEERLLGVSMTGILDNLWLTKFADREIVELKNYAVEVNKIYSEQLGIPASTAITCVKPSGTVSQLVDAASGIHPRWSPYYLRAVRGDSKDPLTEFMKSVGIPNEPDVMKPDATTVFYFPQKAPEGAMVRRDLTAIEHLEIWKKFQDLWCEHKPSITVNVRESEWMGVGAWVFDNFKSVSGVAFLPMDDHSYVQAPYQELTEEQYNEWMAKMPTEKIDWTQLSKFEMVDTTSGSQELACSGGVCEVVEIGKVT